MDFRSARPNRLATSRKTFGIVVRAPCLGHTKSTVYRARHKADLYNISAEPDDDLLVRLKPVLVPRDCDGGALELVSALVLEQHGSHSIGGGRRPTTA
jgi:hypothetical protein